MDISSNFNTSWRKVASTIYAKPTDSKIYGSVDLDVTELEKYISAKRKNGIKTTITQVITLIVGRAIRESVPELNTYVRRGKIVERKQIVAMVSVLLPSGEMGSVKIENADRLSIDEMSFLIRNKINLSKQGIENKTMKSKEMISSWPWPFRKWIYLLYKILTINWGISIPFMSLSANSFGSYVISNIGSVGLDSGYGALLPSGNVSIVLILGNVLKKPAVVNNQIVPRKIMVLSATLDHRVADGSHGGKLFREIKRMIKNPALLEKTS